jgi:hypothetical protein
MARSSVLCFALVGFLAAGCENAADDPAKMEIDANSTTNPPHYDRDIPASAATSKQGDENVSEQTANTEVDATGPSQQESLAGAYNLDDQRGHPVLLVFAGGPDVPEYERLKAAWRENRNAMQQQKVVLVESLLKGKSPEASKTLDEGESQVLRSRYGVVPSQFKVVLVDAQGKEIEEWEGEAATFDAVQKALQK